MKHRWSMLLALGLMLLHNAFSETRLMVVSDIHHMANSLCHGSERFIQALRTGDGKLSQYGDVLLEALHAEVEARQPDALIVTGDLSFNGERASHEALAEALAGIEALGVPVWVIPGNHDINVATPVGFSEEDYHPVEGVSPEAFCEIYRDFIGPATPGASLSYAVPINDRLWVAMTDVAFYEGAAMTFGVFTAGHAQWLETVFKDARDHGAEVVTATHHNLIKHTDFSRDSYLMLGSETMAALGRQYGLRLNLSGHLHVQHIMTQEGLTDAALGAFCIWPHRYAMVTLDDGGVLTYEARSLSDAYLPDGFLDMSREWYLDIATDKVRAWLTDAALNDDDREAMARFAANFNLAYFSGTYPRDDAAWREEPAFELWRRLDDNAFGQYLTMVMEEQRQDALNWNSDSPVTFP